MIIVGGSHFKELTAESKCLCHRFPNVGLLRREEQPHRIREADVDLRHGSGLASLPYNLGVTVCYDSEFPSPAASLPSPEPSFSASPLDRDQHGFQRVRWSCSPAPSRTKSSPSTLARRNLGFEPVLPPTLQRHHRPQRRPLPRRRHPARNSDEREGIIFADLDMDMLHEAA